MMTIFVLVIVALLLTSLSSFSVGHAVDAKRATTMLQDRWAHLSCQTYALRHSSDLLGQQNNFEPSSPNSVQLNGKRYDITLADESAKLNVNFFNEKIGRENTSKLIRRTVGVSKQVRVNLRPNKGLDARTDAFESWGQVFEKKENQLRDRDTARELFEATKSLTCWGKRLNFQTAPAETTFQTLKTVVGPILATKISNELASDTPQSAQDILDGMEMTDSQRASINRLLTSRSEAQSVWIQVSDENSSGEITHTVREYFTQSLSRVYIFRY